MSNTISEAPSMSHAGPKLGLKPWIIVLLAASFYFSQYVLRVLPSVIKDDLMLTFGISAAALGVLGSLFYYPYVAMQMPIGMIVDKFGSRVVLTLTIGFCALSSVILAKASAIEYLYLSRFLLGLCAAAAFVSALKLATNWFPPHMLGMVVGLTQAIGMFGAGTSGPMHSITDTFGWRPVCWTMGGFFILLSLTIAFYVRNAPPGGPKNLKAKTNETSAPAEKSSMKSVFLSRFTWINAVYAGLIYAPVQVLGEYWGNSYFATIYNIPKQAAGWSITLIFVGWMIGGPIAGYISDHIGRKPVMILSAVAGALLLSIFFMPITLPIWGLYLITFLIGFTNTGLIAAYTSAGELHDSSSAGLSLAIANMFSILIGALFIAIVGKILDWSQAFHSTLNSEGLPVYLASDYTIAMSFLPVCAILAFILAFFMKETLSKN